jgi:hypothetical protein
LSSGEGLSFDCSAFSRRRRALPFSFGSRAGVLSVLPACRTHGRSTSDCMSVRVTRMSRAEPQARRVSRGPAYPGFRWNRYVKVAQSRCGQQADNSGTSSNINRAAARAGPRQGNSRALYVADHLIDTRPQGQPRTNKRKSGIQPAHQSLITDVYSGFALTSARSIN